MCSFGLEYRCWQECLVGVWCLVELWREAMLPTGTGTGQGRGVMGQGRADVLSSSGHVRSRESGNGKGHLAVCHLPTVWRAQRTACMWKMRQRGSVCGGHTWLLTHGHRSRLAAAGGGCGGGRAQDAPPVAVASSEARPGWGCLFLALDAVKGRKRLERELDTASGISGHPWGQSASLPGSLCPHGSTVFYTAGHLRVSQGRNPAGAVDTRTSRPEISRGRW